MVIQLHFLTKLNLSALYFLFCSLVLVSSIASCETKLHDNVYGFRCVNISNNRCKTFAILRANSHFSSLTNLSLYLGLDRSLIAATNGFSPGTEFFQKNESLLIPVNCECNGGGFFGAELVKTAIGGESFSSIVDSLQGLTTCEAIQAKNPGISSSNIPDKVRLLVPLKCACASKSGGLLLSYPVSEGDTIYNLARKFNTTVEAIVSANNQSNLKPESFLPLLTSILIPIDSEHTVDLLAKIREPNLHFPVTNVPEFHEHNRKSKKMWVVGVFIAVSGIVLGATIAIAAVFLVIQLKKGKLQNSIKASDLEFQQLSLSVRTTSEKKVSFEGSEDALDSHVSETTPHKVHLETYTMEELKKATEDFNEHNHIEGAVYHGRLNGINLAIKRVEPKVVLNTDFSLFRGHQYPHIINPLGTCSNTEGSDSFLVFEYAKNGSLADWLHGGLAMKSHFIASCNCFLRWNERLKICLDVAVALQYMHHIMNPSYVHGSVRSRNIFLDEELNAKIGDFGMSRLIEDVKTEETAPWDLGYLAPEYVNQGTVPASVDIYAFGIVMLEALSGQKPITTRQAKFGEERVKFSEKFKSVSLSENAEELKGWIDTALGENYAFNEACTFANLACACIEDDPSLRPSAGELVEKLMRLVQGSPDTQQQHVSITCESSSKALVKAAATIP